MIPDGKKLGAILWIFALGLLPSAFCLPSAFAQLRITLPATTPDPAPTAEPAVAPIPAADEIAELTQQLKETRDRLKAYEADNEAYRRLNDLRQTTIRTLNESLAVANAEREVFRRRYSDLNLRMEALGLASVGDNKEALEQRLLKAVRDLGLVRDEKDKLAERMVALSETVLLYMKTATAADPAIRLDVEEQLRAANAAMDESAAKEAAPTVVSGTLNEGQVISVKDELSLVVVNLGSVQGVKVGMPFVIARGNRFVARARVVDVREKLSGAIIEEYGSNTEKVKVGDTMRVDVQS